MDGCYVSSTLLRVVCVESERKEERKKERKGKEKKKKGRRKRGKGPWVGRGIAKFMMLNVRIDPRADTPNNKRRGGSDMEYPTSMDVLIFSTYSAEHEQIFRNECIVQESGRLVGNVYMCVYVY